MDRTSFAVMERLGIVKAASFDDDFAVYRYGRPRSKAFELVRSGHSATFRLFCEAILNRKQITCVYQGRPREICPYIVGHTGDAERALVFQFDGDAGGPLPNWRCLQLLQVKDVKLRDGPWFGESYHRRTQRCVDNVYLDVNENVPNQPGRR